MIKSKLDVLVTFYNQEEYVDKALESIFSQKCNFNFNVIVGDDGSTDGTIKKVEAWIEKYPNRISYYVMNRNPNEKYVGGFRASQNRLNILKHVEADYFMFLDGDDYYCDDTKFQKQIDILDNPNNQDCVACSHSTIALYPDGRKVYHPDLQLKEGKYEIKKYWKNLYFHTNASVVRSETIKKIPFELIENNYNDNMITFLFMNEGKCYYINEAMGVYAQTGDGIWTGGKYTVGLIRNIFMYDLVLKINSSLKKQNDFRFFCTWKDLYKHKFEINSSELELLKTEAINKELKFSLLWINYNSCKYSKRILLKLRYLKIFINYAKSRLITKIFG